jgi:PncC family amidohydrolase
MLDLETAEAIGKLLVGREQNVGVVESSAAGLVSAALLAVPGASRFYRGGGVIYTLAARRALLGISDKAFGEIRPSSEPYVLRMGQRLKEQLGADWVIAESGAAGPDGNGYGDPPGHTCVAVVGGVERSLTVETGDDDRVANMDRFARAALHLLRETLESA